MRRYASVGVALLWLVFLVWTSLSQPPSKANQYESPPRAYQESFAPTNAKAQEGPTKDAEPRADESPDWIAILTGALVFVGLLQFAAFTVQADKLEATVRQMEADGKSRRDSEERQLRAYIHPERIVLHRPFGSAAEFYGPLEIQIKNFGQTPAYDFTASMLCLVGPCPWKQAEEPKPTFTQRAPLAPQGIVEMGFSMPRTIPTEMVRDFQAGKVAIWLLIWIEYVDAFGHKRTTNYRGYHQMHFVHDETIGQMRPVDGYCKAT